MITSALQLAILTLSAAATVGWALAAARQSTGFRWVALAGSVTMIKFILVAALWSQGWWFVGEKVLIGLPLAVLSGAWVVTGLRLDARAGRPRSALTRSALFAATFAAAADLLTQVAIGYPLQPLTGAAVIIVVAATSLIGWSMITRGPRWRRLIVAAGAGSMIMVLVAAAVPWAGPATASQHGQHVQHEQPQPGQHNQHGQPDQPAAETVSVADLRTPASVTGKRIRMALEAQQQAVGLPSGKTIQAWTYGSLPGPTITAEVGDVVEVTLRNRDLEAGATIHWHGYHVPNGEDGVAGITQDAVVPGASFAYRFVAGQAGTYWYHTHQRSAEGVQRGLYGTLVVQPKGGPTDDVDLVLPFHTQGGGALLGADDTLRRQVVPAGRTVRLRLINTDQVSRQFVLSGTDFRVAAIDGTDLIGPTPLRDQDVRLPAGGRYDLTFTMPPTPVRLGVIGYRAAGLLITTDPDDPDPGAVTPAQTFDPLGYGTPAGPDAAPTSFQLERTVVLDRLPRWHEGKPAFAYTMDGQVYPHVPPTVVREGDLVRFRIVNRGFETHPMHPHGHHVRVLSVNGRAPTGSPLWFDTFEVRPGEVWEVALRADNPGIWMDHCHHLEHASLGMMTHLEYVGVSSPFASDGPTGNEPE